MEQRCVKSHTIDTDRIRPWSADIFCRCLLYTSAFVSVVTDTKDEIIIKAVNFAGDVDPVSITLDCQVQGDYTVTDVYKRQGLL